jgi:hypothetical protein
MEWKCKTCGGDRIEEVLGGVTQSTEVLYIEKDENDCIMFEYGNCSTDGGDMDSIYFQCMGCGEEVAVEDIPTTPAS